MKKILLDTDIGGDIDDAICLAYLLREPLCDLIGVTTVCGDPQRRASVADALCKAAGRRVPIVAGLDTPLQPIPVYPTPEGAGALARWPHAEFPRGDAPAFLYEILRRHPQEVTLIAIGNLTNVATLLLDHPDAPGLMAGLYVMNGYFGAQPLPDPTYNWNAWADPMASRVAFAAQVAVHRAAPLEVTDSLTLSLEQAQGLFAADDPLLAAVMDFGGAWLAETGRVTLHDPLAAILAFHPEICRLERGFVRVETQVAGRLGATAFTPSPQGNVEIIRQVDRAAFYRILSGTLRGTGASPSASSQPRAVPTPAAPTTPTSSSPSNAAPLSAIPTSSSPSNAAPSSDAPASPPRHGLPPDVVRRAQAAGAAGQAWLDGLDGLIASLEAAWGLRAEGALSGGTHAYVAHATTHAGQPCVLKIDMPESMGHAALARGVAVLRAADGRGYPRLLRVDEARRACLLERLGPPLSASGLPVARQIALLCQALEAAWRTPLEAAGLPGAAETFAWFRSFLPETWEAVGRPCPGRVVRAALSALLARERAARPEGDVLLHGDAHARNALSDGAGGYKLIDPDGLIGEKAYDLGVLMREWPEAYAARPVEEGRQRCLLLQHLTGVDAAAIWQWGQVQMTSTALVLLQIGQEAQAQAMLRVAGAWANATYQTGLPVV